MPGASEKARAIAPKKTLAPEDGSIAMPEVAPGDAAKTPALSGVDAQETAPAGTHLDGRSAAMARYTPPQPLGASSAFAYSAPQQRPMVRRPPDEHAPASAVSSSPAMVPLPAPPSPAMVAAQSEMVPAPVEGPSQVAAQTLQQAELVSQPANGLPVLRLAKRARLPSGLNTISSAVLLNRLVAVDAAGSVFLSQDGGRHWEPIFAPWTGKAVEVQASPQALYRLVPASDNLSREKTAVSAQPPLNASVQKVEKDLPPPPSASSAAGSLPAPAATTNAPPPNPAMLFKLITDHHEVWVSPDGKVWRQQ